MSILKFTVQSSLMFFFSSLAQSQTSIPLSINLVDGFKNLTVKNNSTNSYLLEKTADNSYVSLSEIATIPV